MVTATSQDALLASRFSVDIDGVPMAYFQGVSGFSNESTLIDDPVAIGSGVTLVRKLPGQLTWEPITLMRGLTSDKALWEWRKQVIDGKTENFRRNGSIVMYNHASEEVARYNFTEAWPSAWMGPMVTAGDDAVIFESITIEIESLERVK